MESFGGGEGGVGDWALPLAAFAAGVVAPERTSTALRNWSAIQEQQLRQKEATETRAFREKQFASQEAERADVGKTREQQRETSAVQLAQMRAQQQAGQMLPGLQFSRDVSVGQPDIPAQLAAPDFPTQEGFGSFETAPRVPGWQVKSAVPMTVEDMRKQIMELSGAPPDVRAEMFEKLRGFGVPLTAPKEPEEIQRARHALASEQFLTPQTGAVPARRISELIRSGAAQLPPEVLQKAITGDIRTVDTGQYIQFIDLNTKKIVATVQKTPEAKVQVVDDPMTGKKIVLFINPITKSVEALATDIPVGGSVGPDLARWLSYRTQNQVAPGMPPQIASIPPETALEMLRALGVGAGSESAAVQIMKGLGVIPPPGAKPPTPALPSAPKKGAAPAGRNRTPREEAEEYLRGGAPSEPQ
mgnify:CR=1 FL=1